MTPSKGRFSFLLPLTCLIGSVAAAPLEEFVTRQSNLLACVRSVFGNTSDARIVGPTDPTFTDARLGEKIQFDEFPSLIVFAEDVSEVPALVNCAQKSGIRAVPRTGGHHFEAYSTLTDTMTIDISHINYVQVSEDRNTAVVGAGIRLGALYNVLWKHERSFNGGICPTVGLSGFLSSGGFSNQMRDMGLGIDYIQSAKVVLANGQLVTASASENPDLFWAVKGGGGGTYGIVVEYVLEVLEYPRSSMVLINWNETDTNTVRYDVAKRFLDWAPRQDRRFTSQVNVYGTTVQVVGQFLNATGEELTALINDSGLLTIGKPEPIIDGGCNQLNSRLFGYTTFDCQADNEVDPLITNVVPQAFEPVGNYPRFGYNDVPADPAAPVAPAWPRFWRIAKSFIVQKDNLLPDDALRNVIDRIAQLPPEASAWGEWHAWNLSSTADGSDAFAWRDQAYAHLEFQIRGSDDMDVQNGYHDWMADLEGYLRPIVGPASYTGYADSKISVNPLESYFGNNVCKLINVKNQYDPGNFFQNPASIPVRAENGLTC
ncbi:FAD-binding domain-containing protein [Eremomyces bilateralis CBS 781.70]|uniref:FAD-binding domain-containing protein n=1 Tax=Eremomyces bilateralis CBS 781.70 TaxID=1392243 RepID=A0A6G1G604_9PEZI|nr:FAD-binding domain-containing protein [Eremomyces bilateralis CBS 781.70]KAF1813474.1 FAD-binding domain-containing protein [Eremomyces bilateralis CBS 781.70]